MKTKKTISPTTTTYGVALAAYELSGHDHEKFSEIMCHANIPPLDAQFLWMLAAFDSPDLNRVCRGYGIPFQKLLDQRKKMIKSEKNRILAAVEDILHDKNPAAKFKSQTAFQYLSFCLYEANEK